MEPPCCAAVPLVVLAAVALLIVIVGGSIRINDAGESCPNAPCFGTQHFVVSEEAQGAYWDANPDQIDSRGEDHRYGVPNLR